MFIFHIATKAKLLFIIVTFNFGASCGHVTQTVDKISFLVLSVVLKMCPMVEVHTLSVVQVRKTSDNTTDKALSVVQSEQQIRLYLLFRTDKAPEDYATEQ